MFYEDVLLSLVETGCRFLIAGGVAVNLHGIPRMTQDLDLVVDLDPENVLGLVETLLRLGYRPRAPVDPRGLADPAQREAWIRDKGLKALSFHHPAQPFLVVDVLLDVPVEYSGAVAHAVTADLGSMSVQLVSIDDLIRMKTAANRPQDRSDIEHLERLKDGRGT